MATRKLGIILHGVTGRMGLNQHLTRSIHAIMQDGGVKLPNGDRVMPDPIIVGRNADKIEALARRFGIKRTGTDIAAALADDNDEIFFDAGSTQMRASLLKKAIAAGKHIYCEKPIADTLDVALDVAVSAETAGVKNGAVQDKLFLPGLIKLKMLRDAGFFGKILSVRGEFGYWVFAGDRQPAQRPSWNYRLADSGGITIDMLCHWRYVLDNVIAPVRAVSCLSTTHLDQRWDENGTPYNADADDAAYATFQLEGGIVAQINSSWCTRVNRDDLVTFQVDGTEGSAVAGLHRCICQPGVATPKPVWNPDEPQTMDFPNQWQDVPDTQEYPNGFRAQWELFIRHVVNDEPYPFTLRESAKGVQLAEAALKSSKSRRWIDIGALEEVRG